jgi:hypothetical protein
MKVLYDLCDVLEEELKEIVRSGDMSPQILDNAYKAVDIIKDIETINAMKEASYGGYSNDNRYMPIYGEEYNMTRGRSNTGHSMARGYSRDDEQKHLMEQMEEMRRQIQQMQMK